MVLFSPRKVYIKTAGLTKRMKPVRPSPLDLSVVTVTYNERDNIRLFIEEVNKVFQENHLHGEIIVVDDSSPDGTSDVVLELKKKYPSTRLIKRPGKMGISSAYRDGLAAAQGNVVTLLDADLSHSPAQIPELYAVTKEKKIGWGSRYLGDTKFETDFFHRCGTLLLNKWASFWLKTGMKDHTLGYFVIQREQLQQIMEYGQSKGIHPFDQILYGLPIAAIAKRLSIPIVEIKAPYNQRIHGETKIAFLWGVRVVFADLLYTLKLARRLRT